MFGENMAGKWPINIRDPIHDLIRFDDDSVDRLLLKLIDCREFQRLKRIKQLGFSDQVFPGATHTRFSHSLGIMWNAKRLLERLSRLDKPLVSDEDRLVILAGALLHDLGHGPFSHAFEKVTQVPHERRTVEIILDADSEIHQALAAHDSALPFRTASLFEEGADLIDDEKLSGYKCPKYLQDIVSSQLDADRWDYLIRDSHFSGTEYGRFDVQWLIDHLEVDRDNDRLFLTRKAHHAVEGYIFARYHMYQSVYFHKATRAAEVMLRLLFQRYKKLLDEKDTDRRKMNVVPDAPYALLNAFAGDQSLANFLTLDDHSITAFLKAAQEAKDKTLCYLARGLLHRRLYKCVDATDAQRHDADRVANFKTNATQNLESSNNLPVDKECALESDKPSDTPYKIYDPDAENPATQIYIQLDTNELVEVRTISGLVEALKQKVSLLRYYFPPEARDLIDPIAAQHLKGE